MTIERPLSVEIFKELMNTRDGMHSAQFNEVKALISALRETVEHLDEGLSTRMDVANGRTTKLEDLVAAVKTNGCGQLATHRKVLETIGSGGEEPAWHERPVVRGVGGGAIFVAVLEVIRELITHSW